MYVLKHRQCSSPHTNARLYLRRIGKGHLLLLFYPWFPIQSRVPHLAEERVLGAA